MTNSMMILCAVLSIGIVGTGAVLDIRAAERDRAARSTDYSNPSTLLTLRHSRVEDKDSKRKA